MPHTVYELDEATFLNAFYLVLGALQINLDTYDLKSTISKKTLSNIQK